MQPAALDEEIAIPRFASFIFSGRERSRSRPPCFPLHYRRSRRSTAAMKNSLAPTACAKGVERVDEDLAHDRGQPGRGQARSDERPP